MAQKLNWGAFLQSVGRGVQDIIALQQEKERNEADKEYHKLRMANANLDLERGNFHLNQLKNAEEADAEARARADFNMDVAGQIGWDPRVGDITAPDWQAYVSPGGAHVPPPPVRATPQTYDQYIAGLFAGGGTPTKEQLAVADLWQRLNYAPKSESNATPKPNIAQSFGKRYGEQQRDYNNMTGSLPDGAPVPPMPNPRSLWDVEYAPNMSNLGLNADSIRALLGQVYPELAAPQSQAQFNPMSNAGMFGSMFSPLGQQQQTQQAPQTNPKLTQLEEDFRAGRIDEETYNQWYNYYSGGGQ